MNTFTEQQIRDLRGAALRYHRRLADLSAEELAQMINAVGHQINISNHAIYSYEKGRVRMSDEVAEIAAAVLGLLPEQLLPDVAGVEPKLESELSAVERPAHEFNIDINARPSVFPLNGITVADRVAFVTLAEGLVHALVVLADLIPMRSDRVRTDLSGQTDLYLYASREADRACGSVACQKLLAVVSGKGYEELHQIARLCNDAKKQLDDLVKFATTNEGRSSSDMHEKCTAFADSLRGIVKGGNVNGNLQGMVRKYNKRYTAT